MVERRHNAKGALVTVSEAVVKVRIGGELLMNAGEGNGPVHALDQALRKDLGLYQPVIKDLELADFKVRILTGGTDAVTRVLIESLDRKTGRRWFTVGVSPNIVDASFEALLDSIIFKLWIDGVTPAPSPALQ
jgi:2-isopropylmalate synthase